MSLFLHHIFPVAWGKSEHTHSIVVEIEMFRKIGLSSFKNILFELSKDPAMIFWLDNNENHKGEINENYGRELLELFSMGVGNTLKMTLKTPLVLLQAGHSGNLCLYILSVIILQFLNTCQKIMTITRKSSLDIRAISTEKTS